MQVMDMNQILYYTCTPQRDPSQTRHSSGSPYERHQSSEVHSTQQPDSEFAYDPSRTRSRSGSPYKRPQFPKVQVVQQPDSEFTKPPPPSYAASSAYTTPDNKDLPPPYQEPYKEATASPPHPVANTGPSHFMAGQPDPTAGNPPRYPSFD